jgi:ABC-type bacteriocin/lantibiotic exporter with double-glycine peptidase domain
MLLRYPGKVLTASILGIAVGMAGWAMAIFIQSVLDRAEDLGYVRLLAIAVAIVIAVRAGLIVFRRLFQLAFVRGLERRLAREYVDHLLRADYLSLTGYGTSDLYQRFRGMEHFRNALEDRLLGLFFDVFIVLAAGAIIFTHSPLLSILAAAGAVVPAVIVRWFRKSIERTFEETQRRDSDVMKACMDAFSGMRDLRVLGGAGDWSRRIDEKHESFQSSRFRHLRKLSILGTATSLFSSLIHVAILAIGAALLASKDLSAGQLMFIYTLSGFMLGPIENLVVSWIFFDSAIVALRRREEILTIPPEPRGFRPWPEDWTIRLEAASFGYVPGRPVLREISIEIPQGSSLAIVGESGAGKSSLLFLLSGLVRPVSGDVRIGGVPVHEIDRTEFSRFVGVVYQNPRLFHGTVRDNLLLGRDDRPADEELARILRQAGVDFVSSGNVPFDPDAPGFSSGEIQRLAIARALCRTPRVLLLDEPTSNLDSATEEAVWSALALRPKSCTLVFVTHRLKSSTVADRVLVLEDGRIAETGTCPELMEARGIYYDLWSRQMPFPPPFPTRIR